MLFEVEVKCGHVGRNNFTIRTVPVKAANGKEAAAKARMMPRVKHDHPDAIRQVRVIDAPRYAELVAAHKADPYFQCRCIQEQRELCTDLELFRENRRRDSTRTADTNRGRTCYSGKELIRNPKKYLRYYRDSEDNAA